MINIGIDVVAPPSGPICDFCSHTPVVARYHANEFEMKSIVGELPFGLHQMSVGDWAACSDCEKLIDALDWEGLVARAVVTFFDNYPQLRHALTDAQKKTLKEDFWNLYRQLRENGFTKAEHL